ncbi:uncharacterized protein DUF1488 [Vibrio sp. ES.051]|uniref:DUF1488 domain-containing protein n=1 Tax=Vibrio sp. ES.051 TaxID=1761909 RepID=UPI000BF93CBE|nr:DUF1488 domain-containing protein [Vibrio sp. ES.051]PFG45658.1 uncharacterized protein DUF1488 [Vibrio sp. ES.051]
MNQAILFPDLQSWDESSQSVNFPAQQAGALIECYVTKQKLATMNRSDVEGERQAMEAFLACRFDLEEIAEELIEDEAFDEEGHIVIV